MLSGIALILSIAVLAASIYNRNQTRRMFRISKELLDEADKFNREIFDQIEKYTSSRKPFFERQFKIPADFSNNPNAYIELHKEAILNKIRVISKESLFVEEVSPGEFKVSVKV